MGAIDGDGEETGPVVGPDPLAATVGCVTGPGDATLGNANGVDVMDGVRSSEVGVAEGVSGRSDFCLKSEMTPTINSPTTKTTRAPATRMFKVRPFPTFSTSPAV